MKVKMPDAEWKEVGDLVGVSTHMFSPEMPPGTIFISKSGVQVFLSTKDMDKMSGTSSGGRLF